ncbi:MAG: serpin family protein [Proteobacteria bacterium]|nr:serpin family protein [Pseudomonadota bacterium]
MKSTPLLACVLLLALPFASCTQKNPEPKEQKPAIMERDPFPPTPVGRQITELKPAEFVFQLYRLKSDQPANFMYSPLGLKLAFELLYPGATGDIQKTLEKSFGLGTKTSLSKSESKSAPQVKIASGVWMKSPSSAQTSYREAIKEMGSEIKPLSLAGVNDFVKNATEGKIPKILDSVSPEATLVAVNALYFKGDWIWKFDPSSTAPDRFQSSPYSTTVTQMMHQTSSLSYGEDKTAQWVELPYEGGSMVMTLILPKKRFELAAIEKDLSSSSMKDRLSKSKTTRVEIVLPKFKFEQKRSMKELLLSAGYSDLFTLNEWKKIASNPPKLSDVIQAIAIEVDEKGTEAAAATAAVMTDTALMNPLENMAEKFICDQPFMFLLRNTKSGEIHFIGKVYAPDPVK